MKKIILSLVIIVAFAGFLWYQHGGSDNSSPSPSPSATDVVASLTPTATASSTATTSPTKTSVPTPTVKSFTVKGGEYYFDPAEIRVNKGDTVKITFVNQEGQHNWVIDAFNARTPIIGSGKTATVQFVADKTGTFEYYCSVGNHRQLGMHGNLIVQ
jgi:nitrite reductase (NO-forming)